jgi:hypothetical protein
VALVALLVGDQDQEVGADQEASGSELAMIGGTFLMGRAGIEP